MIGIKKLAKVTFFGLQGKFFITSQNECKIILGSKSLFLNFLKICSLGFSDILRDDRLLSDCFGFGRKIHILKMGYGSSVTPKMFWTSFLLICASF